MQYMPLVEWCLRHRRNWYWRKTLGDDELRGLGYLALCRAAAKFDESRGVKFVSYATFCIDREFRRKRRTQPNIVSAALPDLVATQPDQSVDHRDEIEVAMKRLTKVERRVIQMFVESYADPEIGAILGLSRQRVHQIRHTAMEKMRDAITG